MAYTVRAKRPIYNSHGETFAEEGDILTCRPGSVPNTVILTRKDQPGYPLMGFADDVEPMDNQP